MAIYMLLSGIVFVIVAILHFVRLVRAAPVLLGGVPLPMWVSWLGLFGALALGIWGIIMGVCLCGA